MKKELTEIILIAIINKKKISRCEKSFIFPFEEVPGLETSKIYQIIKIAKMYYELKMSQEEISKKEGISKSTVSRLLQKGLDQGYIQVRIEYPMESVTTLAEQLKQCFGLKEVFVSQVTVNDNELILRDICKALVDHLDQYIHDNDIIGVSWGITMNFLANSMHKLSAHGVKVVQMNGGVPRHTIPTGGTRIVDSLSAACNGEGYLFPVPAVVDSKIIADVLKNDSQVRNVLSLAQASETTIFSVGAVTKNSILYQAGYFKEEEYQRLAELNAVGDICSRFFNIDGEIVDKELDDRVVGITLDEIRKKKNRIALVSGLHKIDALLGALNGHYLNILYIDERSAARLLDEYHQRLDHQYQDNSSPMA
jgi:deoxyribonucleoside regulator